MNNPGIDIAYQDLPITVYEKISEAVLYPPDAAFPAEYAERKRKIDYTYTADPREVFEYFYDNAEYYKELAAFKKGEHWDSDGLAKYLEENLEELADEYEGDIAEHFREKAIEQAEDYYEPEEGYGY